MNWIIRAWKGEEKLWKVFWFGGVIIDAGFTSIKKILGHTEFTDALFAISAGIYLVWLFVSEWRCAFNAKWNGWGYIMRGFIILMPLWWYIWYILSHTDFGHRT